MFKQKDLDVVFVTLPNYLASIVTQKSLKKKLHVFCEKPPDKNLNDLKKVISVKKNKNLKLKYGFNHRYHGSAQKAKEILEKKNFGKYFKYQSSLWKK